MKNRKGIKARIAAFEKICEKLEVDLQTTNSDVDLGIKDFAITSDGKKYKNNRYTKKYRKRLAKAQKHLSRKQKGSNGYERQRPKAAKIYEKIANGRNDNLHKVSVGLIGKYDLICVEDFNVKGMVKNHKLARHIQDASRKAFLNYLQYKADWNGKQIVKIDRFYHSSRTCSVCDHVYGKAKDLSIRNLVCPKCGGVHDRDINAAKNILKEGLRNMSPCTGDYTVGDGTRHSMEGCCQ